MIKDRGSSQFSPMKKTSLGVLIYSTAALGPFIFHSSATLAAPGWAHSLQSLLCVTVHTDKTPECQHLAARIKDTKMEEQRKQQVGALESKTQHIILEWRVRGEEGAGKSRWIDKRKHERYRIWRALTSQSLQTSPVWRDRAADTLWVIIRNTHLTLCQHKIGGR